MVAPLVIASLVGAGASLLGGAMAKKGADDANETSIELANTAMQRKVADLKAAGLNPMLAYTQGGAGTPQITNAAAQGVASAQQAGQTAVGIQQMANMEAQTDLLKAQADKARTEAQVARESSGGAINSILGAGTTALSNARWADLSNEERLRLLIQQTRALNQTTNLGEETFDSDVRQRKAESLLRQLSVAEGKAGSEFWTDMKDKPMIIKLLMQILGGGMSSAKDFQTIYNRR